MKKSSRIWSLASAASFIAAIVLSALFINAWGDVLESEKSIYELYEYILYLPLTIFVLTCAGTFCISRNSGITLKKHPIARNAVIVVSTIALVLSFFFVRSFAMEKYKDFYVYAPNRQFLYEIESYGLPIVLLCWFFGLLYGFIASVVTNRIDDEYSNPEMPKISGNTFTCYFFAFIFFCIFIYTICFGSFGIGLLMLFCGLALAVYPIAKWKYDISVWREDPEKYYTQVEEARQRKQESAARTQAFNERMEEQKKLQHVLDKIPDCPNCGAWDVTRISTASRAASVMTVGLASGKIGKQYRCNKCKHMW